MKEHLLRFLAVFSRFAIAESLAVLATLAASAPIKSPPPPPLLKVCDRYVAIFASVTNCKARHGCLDNSFNDGSLRIETVGRLGVLARLATLAY